MLFPYFTYQFLLGVDEKIISSVSFCDVGLHEVIRGNLSFPAYFFVR